MEEFLDGFAASLENQGAAGNTLESYRRDLLAFLAFMRQHGYDTGKLEEAVAAYVIWLLEKGRANSTISRHVSAIRTFCRYLKSLSVIETDLGSDLKTPKVTKTLPTTVSPEVLARLLQQPDTRQPLGIRDKAILELVCSTGLRATEVVSLDVDDFDGENGAIHLKTRGAIRDIPLPERSRVWCSTYLQSTRAKLANTEEKAFFVNHHGRRLTRQGFWKIIKHYARSAGVGDITSHILRHSVAAQMAERGEDTEVIQQLLGHADAASTAVYQRLVKKNRRAK